MTLLDQDLCRSALQFAATAHAGQRVPGTERPYVVHVAEVVMEVMAAALVEPGRNVTMAVLCALMHDVIEDTATPYETIVQRWGSVVADGVLALSKSTSISKSTAIEDSLRRIHEQPQEIWMVKLADRIVNLQPPPAHWTKAKMTAYKVEAMHILDSLGEASPFLAMRLSNKIAEYQKYIDGAAEKTQF
jgi:(p)ppGpp synthase/HD superfamily hydrolase